MFFISELVQFLLFWFRLKQTYLKTKTKTVYSFKTKTFHAVSTVATY